MNLLRKLIPSFLKQLDLDWQRYHPRLWSTRIHYHLWFLFLVNVAVFALGCIIRVTTLKFPDPEDLFGYMITPALIYFAFWVYKVVLFTVERRFGIRKPYEEVWEFLIHFVSIALILTIPYNLMLTAAWRIGHLVDDEEFVREVDLLNDQSYLFIAGNGYVFADDLDPEYYRSGSSSHHYFRSLEEYTRRHDVKPGQERSLQSIYEEYISSYNRVVNPEDNDHDPETAKWYRTRIDSIEQRYPLYLVEHGRITPRYYDYYYDDYGDPDYVGGRTYFPFRKDSLLELDYIARIRTNTPPDRERIAEALTIARKYDADIAPPPVDAVIRSYNERRNAVVANNIVGASHQIRRIWEAKTWHYDPIRHIEVFYALAITCFVLALVLSIFKNIYWQPFLITLVTSMLLPVLILIFAMLTEDDIIPLDDDVIMMYSYYWIALFLIIMLAFINQMKSYGTARAVMLILANLAVPFFALFTLAILHDRWDIFGLDALNHQLYALRDQVGNDNEVLALEEQVKLLNEKVARIMMYALWGGLIGYVLILHPLFRNLYTRLMALPERK